MDLLFFTERSGIRETANSLGLGEDVKVLTGTFYYFIALSNVWPALGSYLFGAFFVKNRESKRDSRTECYIIETDHQLELELPSILSGKNKLQGEWTMSALPLSWQSSWLKNEYKGCRRLIERVIT